MLTQMLEESGALDKLSIPQKTIILHLASKFQSSTEYMFLDPEELEKETSIGTKDQWYQLLNLQETKNYVKGQMAFIANIAQRKTFQELVQMALEGNHQAAKQVQELSGVLNQQDSNRVVVLHRIPRPEGGI